jgi:hypothetical protein
MYIDQHSKIYATEGTAFEKKLAEQELLVEVETIYAEAAKAALDAELANQSNKTEE